MDGFSQLNKHIFRSYIYHIYYILIKPGGMKQICRVPFSKVLNIILSYDLKNAIDEQ